MQHSAKDTRVILDRALAIVFIFIILFVAMQILSITFLLEGPMDILELSFTPDLTHRTIDNVDRRIYEFEAEFSREELAKVEAEQYNLLVYRLAGEWYQVYLNDNLIGSLGDTKSGRSNIWNTLSSFSIPENIIEDNNQITIRAYGRYDLGLLSVPVFITDSHSANLIENYLKVFIGNLNLIIAGFLLFSAILLLFIYNLSKEVGKEYLFYAIAAFFMMLNVFDYVIVYYSSLPMIYLKKMFIGSLYLGGIFYSIAYYYQFRKKINLILGVILLIVTFYGLIFINDIFQFMQYVNFMAFTFAINVLGYIYTTIREYKDSYIAKVMLFINLVIILDLINYFTVIILNLTLNYQPISFLVYPISIMLLVIYHYIEINNQILTERQKAEQMYQQSIIDSMTGVYNHQYLINKIANFSDPFTVVMIDIDDFKEINDNYGHQAGDYVIINLAKRVESQIRDGDLVGRYGGDEFILFLANIDLESAHNVAKRIKSSIEQPYQIKQEESLDVGVSIGIYYSTAGEAGKDAIKKVDQALYRSKNNGKGKITVYDNITEED